MLSSISSKYSIKSNLCVLYIISPLHLLFSINFLPNILILLLLVLSNLYVSSKIILYLSKFKIQKSDKCAKDWYPLNFNLISLILKEFHFDKSDNDINELPP